MERRRIEPAVPIGWRRIALAEFDDVPRLARRLFGHVGTLPAPVAIEERASPGVLRYPRTRMKTVLFASVDVRVSASDDGIVFAGRPTVGLIFIGIGALVWAALALGADTIDASLTGVLRGLAMFSVVSGIVIGL